ncbi:MAG: galactokinase [Steroidobacteraceae bacterium]
MDLASALAQPAEAVGVAPGRVNLLGEHTDYSGGFVLPTAIPQRATVELAHSPDADFHVHSSSLGQQAVFAPDEPLASDFSRYVQGCVAVLRERGIAVPPLAVRIESTVPIGVGLSSSAALEVALLRAIRALLALPLHDVEIAQLAQRAEVEYAGVRCGIMDQMASSLCDTQHMLFLDTRSLAHRLLPLPRGTSILVVDSNTPRALADTAYNERRSECETAARRLGVRELRDVQDVALAARLPPPLDRRARHVISENARVLEAVEATPRRFGELMDASHASLRDDFEVSVPALDRLVQALRSQPGALGARLTGAGFGGACVALVETPAVAAVRDGALRDYSSAGFHGTALV